jgi:hypothetical protein
MGSNDSIIADSFKAVTHKIMNLSFSGEYRLLRGVLDGPIAIGSSTLIPQLAGSLKMK